MSATGTNEGNGRSLRGPRTEKRNPYRAPGRIDSGHFGLRAQPALCQYRTGRGVVVPLFSPLLAFHACPQDESWVFLLCMVSRRFAAGTPGPVTAAPTR